MNQADFTTFSDADDFCRECRGKGMVSYRDEPRNVNISETCPSCGGHGCKTIRVTEGPA